MAVALGERNDCAMFRDLLAHGVADYLVKPITPALLQKSLANAAEHTGALKSNSRLGKLVAVTGTRGGGVQAWEASNGQKLWEITGAQTDFESPEAGPVVQDGTVYVWKDARLRALEARTGEERWSYPIGDAASCGGVPVRLTQAPDGYVYVSAGTRVLAIEVVSGRVRWHFEAPAVFLCPPTFVPGCAW